MLTWQILRKRQRHLFSHLTIFELNTGRFLKQSGIAFRMQAIIYPYIVDFIGVDRNFILEVDGNTHTDRDEYDDQRSEYLTRLGYEVYRIENRDVNFKNIQEMSLMFSYVGKEHMRSLLIQANHDHYKKFNGQDSLFMRLS